MVLNKKSGVDGDQTHVIRVQILRFSQLNYDPKKIYFCFIKNVGKTGFEPARCCHTCIQGMTATNYGAISQ